MLATWADIGKAERLLGWRPHSSFEQGVARLGKGRNNVLTFAACPAIDLGKLRMQVARPVLIYERVGYNYKLTDIQASIGLEQVKKLPAILQMRQEIARHYNEALADLPWLQLPREPLGWTHAYQSYVCLLRANNDTDLGAVETLRRRLWQHLANEGIASVQGAQAMPTIDFYCRKYGWKPQDFPVAFRADRASVALPIYPDMALDDQERVIQSICSFQP